MNQEEIKPASATNPEIVSSDKPSGNFFSFIKSKNFLKILPIALIAIAVPGTALIANQRQNTQNFAAVNESNAVLDRVEINPALISTNLNAKSVPLSALAYDTTGAPIKNGVTYEWGMSSTNSVGTLTRTSGDITDFLPRTVGRGELHVIARIGSMNITKSISVAVSDGAGNLPGCVRRNPTVTVNPATIFGMPQLAVPFEMTIKNNDDSTCPPSIFGLAWNAPSGFQQYSTSQLIASGQTIVVRPTISSPANATPGNYTIYQTITNASSPQNNASTPITYTVLGLYTSVPLATDSDGDGYNDDKEIAMGTSASSACGTNAWPADVNNDNMVNIVHVDAFKPYFNKKAGAVGYNKRFDLNADGIVNLTDLLNLNKVMNKYCR